MAKPHTPTTAASPEARLFGGSWIEGIVTVLFGVWLYFIGWVYSYFYFRFFHVEIFEIDMPLQSIMVQATTPILYCLRQHYLYPIALILIVVLIILAELHRPIRNAWYRHRHTFNPIAFVVVVGIVFFGGFQIAKLAADAQARATWTSEAPEIQFVFKPEPAQAGRPAAQANSPAPAGNTTDDRLAKFNDRLSLRLLLATKDYYYAFVTDPSSDSKVYLADGWIFKIHRDSVRYASIRRRGESIDDTKQ